MDASSIDLLDRDAFVNGVPHDWFTWLRKNKPVYKHPEPHDGPGFWVISKYDDAVAANRNAKVLSSDQGRGGVVGLEDPDPETRAFIEAMRAESGGGDDSGAAAGEMPKLMLTMDPPEHTRYRKLVNKGFTPRMINALEPGLRKAAVDIVDAALAKGEVDFVVDVAAELPLQVIAELLGVPQEDRHKLFEWSNKMIAGGDDPEYAVDPSEFGMANMEMFVYAQQLAEERRREPKDDIVTTLLNAEVDGHGLTDVDFNMFFLLLSVAGNETTRNAIAHGMNAFLENPGEYDRLVQDPSLAKPATEEILRWATPVMYFRRNATEDLELGGEQIKEGDKVSIWYSSANRDEDHFEDPFRFDITRSPNEHIAFGGGGPHFCLGASLARMEIQLLFEELAQRSPSIKQLGPPDRLRSNFIGGIKHLPVAMSAS